MGYLLYDIFVFGVFYFFIYLARYYVFLASVGLHCGPWAFSSCSEWGTIL